MSRNFRAILFLICAVQTFFAVAFFFQWPWAVSLWPYPGTTPLTFIFVASIFAAAAASTFWATASQNYGALAGIALDYVIILVPVSIYSFQLAASGDNPRLILYGFLCLLGVLFGLGLLRWSIRIPLDQTRPVPVLVRGSFVFFTIALVIVSTRLILQVPNAIPWTITPELSVLIGWMFVGAAAYFVYGFMRPSWANAGGQLAGFLAYDLVLIVPFLQRLPTTPPEFRPGLTIYTGVVVFSGLLATYYLFIHKPTRVLWS